MRLLRICLICSITLKSSLFRNELLSRAKRLRIIDLPLKSAGPVELVVGAFRLLSGLALALPLEVVVLNHLEDDGEGDEAPVDDAHQLSVEAVEEADLCVYVRWGAGGVALIAGAVLAVGVAVEDAIGGDHGIAIEHIGEQGLRVVLAEFELNDRSSLLLSVESLANKGEIFTRKSRKARELWREAAAIRETLLQDWNMVQA